MGSDRESIIMTPRTPVVSERRLRRSIVKGEKRINDYKVLELLRKGSFGVAHKCENIKSNEVATIKIVDKKKFIGPKRDLTRKYRRKLEDLYREVEIMQGLVHENVVQLLAVIEDETASHLFIVTEYCAKRGIFDDSSTGASINEPLGESLSRKYFRDVLAGLEFLHYN